MHRPSLGFHDPRHNAIGTSSLDYLSVGPERSPSDFHNHNRLETSLMEVN